MDNICHVIDVSAHQPDQNWTAWKQQGLACAIAKASEGASTRDPRFDAHIAGILKSQLVAGAYHFAWPVQDVRAEAANYIAAVTPYARANTLVHWLDLEQYPDGRNYTGRSSAQILAWVEQWIATVQAAFPTQRVGVYTSAADIAAGHIPDGVPLWFPSYPGPSADTYAEAAAAPQPHPSGRIPLLWQFTSTPADDPRIDESIAYLSEPGLRAWAANTLEDAMPEEVNLGTAKPYPLAPGAWDSIEFTSEWLDTAGDHAAGGSVFARGACRFTGTVSLRVHGLAAGETVQVRMSEYNGATHVHDHPIAEVIGTPGDTFAVVPLVKHLPAGHGMRVRLLNQTDHPVTIASAILTALVWKLS